MHRMDVTDLRFDSESFDAILCTHVLEHVTNDALAMRELLRVLRPGGWAVLQSPVELSRPRTLEDPSVVAPLDRERVFGQRDHVRIYGRDYRNRLEAAGWQVALNGFAQTFSAELVERYGLDRDEAIWLCSRPSDRA